MFSTVAEGIGGRLTERGTLAILIPPAIFWGGGVAALYVHGKAGLWGWGLADLFALDLTGLQAQIPRLFSLSVFEQFVLAIGLVVTSGLAVDRLVFPTLRWLEGYLPSWLDFARAWLVQRQQQQVERDRATRDRLAATWADHTYAQRREFRGVDQRLELRTPRGDREVMPTELGNILRAAETRPRDKYGLDVVVCWPRLWLVLPDAVTGELGGTRANLDTAVRTGLWGALFVIWAVCAWWAAPIGIVVVVLAYQSALRAAAVYGALIESAFDMYRMTLYEHAGWSPPPKGRAEEIERGKRLSRYFWRRPSTAVSPPPPPDPVNSDAEGW